MKQYQYFQPNKKDIKDKQGDCSIRSLCKFLNKSWVDVFDLLVPIARRTQQMLNEKPNLELFMEEQGASYVSVYAPKGKKYTVAKLAKTGEKMICYCRVGFRTHLVAVEDGMYFDTWDCGSRIVYGYWKL